MKIAICEYDERILNFIKNELESSYPDFMIGTFKSPHEIDRIRDYHEFDIYMMDIEFDEASGFDYAREIRATNQKSMIAFITSHDEFAIDAFKISANAYLLKPFSSKELLDMTQTLVSSYRKVFDYFTISENYHESSNKFFEPLLNKA